MSIITTNKRDFSPFFCLILIQYSNNRMVTVLDAVADVAPDDACCCDGMMFCCVVGFVVALLLCHFLAIFLPRNRDDGAITRTERVSKFEMQPGLPADLNLVLCVDNLYGKSGILMPRECRSFFLFQRIFSCYHL